MTGIAVETISAKKFMTTDLQFTRELTTINTC